MNETFTFVFSTFVPDEAAPKAYHYKMQLMSDDRVYCPIKPVIVPKAILIANIEKLDPFSQSPGYHRFDSSMGPSSVVDLILPTIQSWGVAVSGGLSNSTQEAY